MAEDVFGWFFLLGWATKWGSHYWLILLEFFTGWNSVAWYHWYRSGSVLFSMGFLSDWCVCGGWGGGLLVRLTCHMPTWTLQWPSKTSLNCLTAFISLGVKVDVNTSAQSWTIYIRPPDCRWVKMWYVLDLVDSSSLSWSSYLWMSWMTLTSGIRTWVPLENLTLLVQGVWTLM